MIEQLNIHVHFLNISLPKGYNQAKTYKQDVGISREEGVSEVLFLCFYLWNTDPMYTFVFKFF